MKFKIIRVLHLNEYVDAVACERDGVTYVHRGTMNHPGITYIVDKWNALGREPKVDDKELWVSVYIPNLYPSVNALLRARFGSDCD